MEKKKTQKKILKDLDIPAGSLSNEFIKQAPKFAYWSFLFETAKKHRQSAKLSIDVFIAEKSKKLKKKNKLSDKAVENVVKSHSTYKKLYDAFIGCQYAEGVLSVAKEAFEQRSSMLVSLGANLREELDGDIKILKEKAKEKKKKGGF